LPRRQSETLPHGSALQASPQHRIDGEAMDRTSELIGTSPGHQQSLDVVVDQRAKMW
jgi:hypothetical protein